MSLDRRSLRRNSITSGLPTIRPSEMTSEFHTRRLGKGKGTDAHPLTLRSLQNFFRQSCGPAVQGGAGDPSRASAWSGLNASKEFVVVLPIAFHFAHDALKFGVAAQLVPVFVPLIPGIIVISELDGSPQPSESRWVVA